MNPHIFRVTGDDRHTGAERTFFVRAEDEAAAHRFATRRGMQVSTVRPASESDVPEGAPILTEHPPRRSRPELIPWIDFAFGPPSVYLIPGLLMMVVSVSEDSLPGGPLFLAGLTLLILGCIRFATYQRDPDQ